MTVSSDEGLWIRRYHPAPDARRQLVCLPHAGGSASFFHPVSARLSSVAEVLAVQYPGRQDRRDETGPSDLATMADLVYGALREHLRARPTALFGHSMGATLAFEVTRRFEADGGQLSRLFVSGRRAPSRYRDERVHLMEDDGILEELKNLAGTESSLLGDEEIQRLILPALRSDYTAIETYRCEPGAAVEAPVTVLTGDSDPKTSLDEAEDWRHHTKGDFDLRVFPGGHFYLGPRASDVIGLLREHLNAGV
ncbi:thioesterase [Streptomyces sp. HNM0575]|uniref:thioesterase II family protein n=1 Tax=Streptomyces sp. HNM0575 TaxID=2716338 RepID=UPI00145D16A8|nr:alpha/beta fold hydrolase [Streptomyces sp. HNM0575]NLU76618.1 thioesterase [Streptomyces sp. HNM0575]